ncbi:uncharacterized protein LOC122025708 isoform X1 [Zingiber officinale]|uniref:uncharacterized protein LOC122025708 isoform X1 n=2 Tax=Zingiber officinale TaxID=94328 RepID=UPI001C4B2F60|nr:uncharacterized protein LOC122025708 isoform X1 [Zingiber officinale]
MRWWLFDSSGSNSSVRASFSGVQLIYCLTISAMRMAANHSVSFPYGVFPQSFCNQHVVSFQPGAVNSASGPVSGDVDVLGAVDGTTGLMKIGNSSMLNTISSVMSTSNSPGTVLDPTQGLQLRAKFSVTWSFEELQVLKQSIIRYASEPNIMKYVKIAARLPEKTVRDVAMRCRWMTKKEIGKRRKPEDCLIGKKTKDRKDKLINSSSVAFLHQNPSENVTAYSSMRHDGNNNTPFLCGATCLIDSRTGHLLDENVKIFQQIAVNLDYNEIQKNIDLFCCSKQNITTILNSMSGMTGIMSQMPPLPMDINDNLMSILHCTAHSFGLNILDERGLEDALTQVVYLVSCIPLLHDKMPLLICELGRVK